MAEREGVKVFVGWEDEDDEWSLGEVPVTALADLPAEVFGLFDGGPTEPSAVRGHLVYGAGYTAGPAFYRLELVR